MKIIDMKKPKTGTVINRTKAGSWVVEWADQTKTLVYPAQQKERHGGHFRYTVLDDAKKSDK